MKPNHANWVMDAFACIKLKNDLVESTWRYTGISQAVAQVAAGAQRVATRSSKPDPMVVLPEPAGHAKHIGIALVFSAQVDVGQTFTEYFLPPDVCQSRLGSRQGRSACTVIALGAHRVLRGVLPIPAMGEHQLWKEG